MLYLHLLIIKYYKENRHAYQPHLHGESLERKGERFRLRKECWWPRRHQDRRSDVLPSRDHRRKPRAVPGERSRGLRDRVELWLSRGAVHPAAFYQLATCFLCHRPFFRSIHHALSGNAPTTIHRDPPSRGDRTDSPRNNNRERSGWMCNQRSLMAPHYAKRQAKGAWHFLSHRTKNQERLAASCECAHFLLALIGERDATARRRRYCRRRRLPRRWPAASGASGRLAATRCAARRHSKDTTRLGLLGAQPVARAVRTASLSLRFFVVASLRRPLLPLLPSSPYVSDTTSVSMYPIYRRATLPSAATSAATAPTTTFATANCIDASRSNSWHNSSIPSSSYEFSNNHENGLIASMRFPSV